MDLDVVMKSNECPYIVQFYGALFKEVLNTISIYIFSRHLLYIYIIYIIFFCYNRVIVGFVWNLWIHL